MAYKKQVNEIKQIEWMTKMKNRIIEQEERRKKQEELEKIITELERMVEDGTLFDNAYVVDENDPMFEELMNMPDRPDRDLQ